jgi:diguanylate cyclase (GGDEF)-like protein/PAS domain S-box-containing protein
MSSFRAAHGSFKSLLSVDRAGLRVAARERAVLISLVFAGLILLVGTGLMRGFGRSVRRNDARLRALIDSSLDVITVIDADGGVLYQSPAAAAMLGYGIETPAGTPVAHLVHPDDAPRLLQSIGRAKGRDETAKPAECRWRHADGSFRWLETVCNDLLDDPKVAGIVLTSRDVTERRELSDKLRKRAFHDSLTGLANRARFEDALSRSVTGPNSSLAVLFIDLDNFKTVNDSLGHAAGDRFLREMAARVRSCVRATDMVARMGGDEFAVLLLGVDAGIRASRVAERILRALGEPIRLESRVITSGASVGIVQDGDGKDGYELLRDADLALYAAKRAGKGQARFYEPFMHAAALHQLELEADLRVALERGELVLHYQPLFRLTDGKLTGYEALVRWQHPTRGLLLPDSFIELAEQTGLIVPLTRWALQTACEQRAAWQERSRVPLEVAVNLSFINLQDRGVVDDVGSALEAFRIAARDLVLEVTESTFLRDYRVPSEVLHELKELGVRLALDDFGTGHSSLSRLSELPFDSVKIPRPFIQGLGHNNSHFALAQGIVDLGHRMELSVVAEGIETPTQLSRVRAIGCEVGQGFHLATPRSGEATDPGQDSSRGHTIVVPVVRSISAA